MKPLVCGSLVLLLAGDILITGSRPQPDESNSHRNVKPRLISRESLQVTAQPLSNEARTRLATAYGRLPLSFEANQGQADPRVKFVSRNRGYTLFLTDRAGALLVLSKPQPESTPANLGRDEKLTSTAVRMSLVGADTAARVEETAELPGKINYFIGNDPKKWRTNVPTYAKVTYRTVYPGVDLVYYGNQSQLEHDFVVAPGADPGVIRMGIEGAEKLSVSGQGDLVLTMKDGEIRFQKPMIYQEVAGVRHEIAGGYKLGGNDRVGFEIAAEYDGTNPLVIDPALVYSTYLGGSNDEEGQGIAVDSTGSAYVTGYTGSSNFPTTTGAFQTTNSGAGFHHAFVTKLNAAGTGLVYSTYLGGNSEDIAYGIAVDSTGSAYVTGFTLSSNFPTTTGAFQVAKAGDYDGFVTKLNAAGTGLVYSTYLGGSGRDEPFGIAVDSTGSAYVTGYTLSSNFPTTAGAFQGTNAGSPDGFVTKLNVAGTGLVYSTYLGGSSDDKSVGIAVDSTGSAYVTGSTNSSNFPTTTGAFQVTYAGNQDAFVAKIIAAVDSTPGKVTGGGFIQPDGTMSPATLLIQTGTNASVGGTATFGFEVQFIAGAANPAGNLTYNDHGANVTIKALSFNLLVISNGTCGTNTHAKFSGSASVTGPSGVPSTQSFDVDVDDCGEPGSSPGAGPDRFSITTVCAMPYAAAGPVVGGNIQVRKN